MDNQGNKDQPPNPPNPQPNLNETILGPSSKVIQPSEKFVAEISQSQKLQDATPTSTENQASTAYPQAVVDPLSAATPVQQPANFVPAVKPTLKSRILSLLKRPKKNPN